MEEAKLRIIGCGDAFGSGGRLQSCYHICCAESGVLLELGATAYYGLKKSGIELDSIQTIVISHFHGDHFAGLPFLLLDEAIRGRKEPLTIVTPQTGKARITNLLEQLYPGTEVLEKLDLTFEVFMPDRLVFTDHVEIMSLPVVHTTDTHPHGLRISMGDKVIAYSGDTEWTPTLLELARESDVFLCECNYFDSEVSGHLDYRTFEQYEDQLECKKLILTHLGPEMFENRESVKHDCAEDGMEVSF